MQTNMKKALPIIALILISATLLIMTSCKNDTGDTESTTVGETTVAVVDTTMPEPTELEIVSGGKSDYTIIRGDGSPDFLVSAMVLLREKIIDKTGAEIVPSDDFIRTLPEVGYVENDNLEILVGATNRKESVETLAALADGEYTVKVVGKKLVIIGKTDYLTTLAVSKFCALYLSDKSDTLSLPLDLNIKDKSNASLLGDDSGATLRIMTFNVLGDGEEGAKRYPEELAIFDKYSPDIICLQECNAAQHGSVVRRLTDYAVATTYHDKTSTYDYTPIIYKKDSFTLVTSGVEWLDSRYTKTNTKALSWAVLEDKAGVKFAVLNIHGAVWSEGYTLPTGKTHADMYALVPTWRDDNMRQMLEKSDEIIKTYGDIPVMFTGDFNFNSDSTSYAKVTGAGFTEAEVSATISKMTGTKTTHTVGVAPDAGKSIDHIFGNAKIDFWKHYICKTGDELKASDHCAVYADISFK